MYNMSATQAWNEARRRALQELKGSRPSAHRLHELAKNIYESEEFKTEYFDSKGLSRPIPARQTTARTARSQIQRLPEQVKTLGRWHFVYMSQIDKLERQGNLVEANKIKDEYLRNLRELEKTAESDMVKTQILKTIKSLVTDQTAEDDDGDDDDWHDAQIGGTGGDEDSELLHMTESATRGAISAHEDVIRKLLAKTQQKERQKSKTSSDCQTICKICGLSLF